MANRTSGPTWSACQKLVKESRFLQQQMSKRLPHDFVFQRLENGSVRMYFLGEVPGRSDDTLYWCDVSPESLPKATSAGAVGSLEAFRLIEARDAKLLIGHQTREEQLLRERQRMAAYGITSYEFDAKSKRLIFPAAGQLFSIIDQNQAREGPVVPEEAVTPQIAGSAAMGPSMCPSDPDLIAFVVSRNIFISSRRANQVRQITFERSALERSAGVPSYITQEEFDRYTGVWWNPGRSQIENVVYLLYEVVDESQVELVNLPSHSADFVPRSEPFRFARAGTPNAISELRLCRLDPALLFESQDPSSGVQHLQLRKSLSDIYPDFEYLIRAGWASPDFLYCVLMNRLQNELKVILLPIAFFEDPQQYDVKRIECAPTVIFSETSSHWIKSCDSYKFLNVKPIVGSNNLFKATFIWPSEQLSGFTHLYAHNVDFDPFTGVISETSECEISGGQSCVLESAIKVADTKYPFNGQMVCFGATGSSPLENHLYAVGISETDRGNCTMATRCCQLTRPGYYHSFEVADDCSLFVDRFSNLEEPLQLMVFAISVEPTESTPAIQSTPLFKISLNGVPIPVTGSPAPSPTPLNQTVVQSVSQPPTLIRNPDSISALRAPKLFSFTSSISGHTVYGLVFPPPEALESTKCPTMLYVYGGPGIQLVNMEYKTGRYFRLALAATYGIPAVIVDCRGSARRGRAWENHIAQQMGQVEVSEHVEALEAAADKYPFIDMKRIAIHGWSYGGYLSLMALAQRPDIFKMAISGAPATDWRLYDTAWTERYMGMPPTPSYHVASVLSLAPHFPDEPERLWIVHGLLDENVHFAHTAALLDALNRAGKPYRLYAYPNELHGLRQPDNYAHCCTLLLYALLNYL